MTEPSLRLHRHVPGEIAEDTHPKINVPEVRCGECLVPMDAKLINPPERSRVNDQPPSFDTPTHAAAREERTITITVHYVCEDCHATYWATYESMGGYELNPTEHSITVEDWSVVSAAVRQFTAAVSGGNNRPQA